MLLVLAHLSQDKSSLVPVNGKLHSMLGGKNTGGTSFVRGIRSNFAWNGEEMKSFLETFRTHTSSFELLFQALQL